MVSRDLVEEGMGAAANGYRVLLGVMRIFWNFRVIMLAQLCEYAKTPLNCTL